MARPLRNLYRVPVVARRRHRTWMMSITLATAGLAVWGATVVWMRADRPSAPSLEMAYLLSSLFSLPGWILGLLTIRAKRSWLWFAMVPIAFNTMLLVLPWILIWLREHRAN
ncbi:MAG TPA: hypothetical protein VK843_01780 [Planctomycetota bacterium]|nr:hypothetical protein [Planctomycetota bacterium]